MKVRTRFAPSPTGYLHVGGIRTALFAWLVARQAAGDFVLRLEDTDKKREVEGAEAHIEKSLRALEIDYDEGPDIGGPFEPYRQSQRLEVYEQWGQKLIDSGRAYADPFTPEEVQAFRDQAQQAKKPFLYREHRPADPPAWDGGQPLRFKSDPKAYDWQDAVMGDLHSRPEAIDDFILIKSDGYPTYNFSHIVDDAVMEMTHVIRGQEFLASVPNYLNFYEALGLKRPVLATLPHIMGPDGKKKLSKRDGAKDVLDYLREGFLPEALVSFIATMGWNDGTEQEIFSRDELIKKFDLARVQRSGAKFDEQRLLWVNGHFIRQMTPDELYERSEDFWGEPAAAAEPGYRKRVLGLIQERLKYLAELPELSWFFFEEPAKDEVRRLLVEPEDKQLKKLTPPEIKQLLEAASQSLSQSDYSLEDIEQRLNGLLDKLSSKPGILFAAIRVAVTGAKSSPPLAGTLEVLGKPKSLERLESAIALLG
jgi:glutamyl-tRNA synthetase